MEKSSEIKSLATALSKFQSEVGNIKKDATNPFFKSKYASLSAILDEIKKPLADNKLAVSQFPCNENGLTTILMHESGEFISETYQMKPVKQDPQGIGSAITYQRRYALGAILGLNIDEDDDANEATKTEAKKEPEQKDPALKEKALQAAISLIKCQTSVEAVKKVWTDHKHFQTEKSFIDAKEQRKLALDLENNKK